LHLPLVACLVFVSTTLLARRADVTSSAYDELRSSLTWGSQT
jgi:hypothetical protein